VYTFYSRKNAQTTTLRVVSSKKLNLAVGAFGILRDFKNNLERQKKTFGKTGLFT